MTIYVNLVPMGLSLFLTISDSPDCKKEKKSPGEEVAFT